MMSRLIDARHESLKVRVQRGTDDFLVCISQLSVNNLKCLFQISDSDRLLLCNETKGIKYFPKEDGTFDLSYEDARNSRTVFVVQLPDANHSRTNVHQQKTSSLSGQCRGLSARAEKRLRIGDVGALDCAGTSSSLMNRNHVSDQNIEILKQLEELRGTLLTMREDVGALLTMREDVRTLLTMSEDVLTILSRNLQDRWGHAGNGSTESDTEQPCHS